MGNVAPPLVGNVVPQATGTNSLGTCKNAGASAGNGVRFSRFFLRFARFAGIKPQTRSA